MEEEYDIRVAEMKCGKCGNEVVPGKLYCPVCGHEIQVVSDSGILEDDMLEELLETSGKQDKKIEGSSDKKSRTATEKTKSKENSLSSEKKKVTHKKTSYKKLTLLSILAVLVVILVVILCLLRIHSYGYLYEQGKLAYNTGKFQTACDNLEKAVLKEPDSEEAYLLLGRSYAELGETEKAEKCLKQVIKWNPSSLDAYEALLDLYENDTDQILALKSSVTVSDKDILALFSAYETDMPVASYEGGTYNKSIEVSLTAESGEKIFYTLDGKEPEKYGDEYKDAVKISEEGETVLKAVAQNSQGIYSDVLTVTYEIAYEAPDMPTASPDGGSFTQPSQVTISSKSGTTVYYTWDGSIPDTGSQKYEGPLDVPEGNNILSVIAVDDTTGKTSGILRSNFIYYPE